MFYDSEDQEELHHSQYFKYVFEQTGQKCKLVPGLKNISFQDGVIVDGEGEQIVNDWKTWSYNTIITIWNGTPLRTSGEVSNFYF